MPRTTLVCIVALVASLGAGADSLFSTAAAKDGTLIAEKASRFEIGDIITVSVSERIDATATANTNTKKEAEVSSESDESDNNFLTAERDEGGLGILNGNVLPNWATETENETKNTGSTRRSSTLQTQVSCFVTKVYPNGNLMISGERLVSVNREDSTLVLNGIIRAEDVTPANTIISTQIANLDLTLKGRGPLWNNQRRGIFTKMLDWVSPF